MRATFGTYLLYAIIWVQIIIYSHSFHVNKADNATLKTPIGLKMHQKSVQKQEKTLLLQNFIP